MLVQDVVSYPSEKGPTLIASSVVCYGGVPQAKKTDGEHTKAFKAG